jgi:ketol-acid reductoisomerase
MSLTILSGPQDAPIEPLLDRTIGIVGFGNQGAAHAQNLRDSGIKVLVANRPDSANGRRALETGFEPLAIAEVTDRSDLLIIALPDEQQGVLWSEQIAPALRRGATVGFLHGFAIRFGLIEPPDDIGVIMVAPKGPGHALRWRYERGEGIPCLFAVHQESPAGDAEALGLAWANGIGCARAAIVQTSFANEAETDLFGEQAVLCGGLLGLVQAAFETLVDAGYPPELAYMECCQEIKQVTDLLYERGPAGMMAAISNTAEFGTHHAARRLIDDPTRDAMWRLLEAVRNGDFARTFLADHAGGFEWFNTQRKRLRAGDLERAGAAVRSWMPWLGEAASR